MDSSLKTQWRAMHRDADTDWAVVCAKVFPDEADKARRLFEEMAAFAERLLSAPGRAADFGIPNLVIEIAMARCANVVMPLLREKGTKFSPGA